MFVRKFEKITKIPEGYVIDACGARVKLCFMTPWIVRARVSFSGGFEERSYALAATAWDDELDELFKGERRRVRPLDVPFEDNGGSLSFRTPAITLVMRKDPLSFEILDNSDGKPVYSDLQERAFDRDHLGRITHYSRIDPEHDHFYGFGEQAGELDKRGRQMRLCPKDAIGHDPRDGGPLYKHIPFYARASDLDPRFLGIFYNNSYDAVFDMGAERSGYWKPYCYYQADGGDLDVFFIYGPSLKDVVRRYCFLTGTSAMPTFQETGFTASTMYYAELERDCDQEILRVVQKHLDEGLYIDNFWLASGYSSGEEDNLRYTFHWNRRRFPDPDGFCRKLSEMGVNLIPNLKPGVLEHHPYAGFYRDRRAYVMDPDGREPYVGRWWGGPGRFIDFTSKDGRQAWSELLKKEILSRGVKVVWNDNCEYDGIDDRLARVGGDGHGGTMAQYKAIQPNMMAYCARQALSDAYPGERPFITSRGGFAGIQRYAQVWDGDNRTSWDALKYNVATILGMGISGVANTGCDIGGFAGPAPGGELLLRWIQNGIFQPRFTINSANSDNTVTQPWMYPRYLGAIRKAWALRYRLLVYIYSLMRVAHEQGLPVMRPLFMEFPDDPATLSDKSLTFMLGKGLLVASVLEEGAAERRLYLPAGHSWFDIGDDFREYEGGREIAVRVDDESIPMFLCDSAIVISSDDIRRAAFDHVRTLKVLVAARRECSFGYYEDDGHSEDFKHGIYALTTITARPGKRLEISFEKHGSYRHSYERLDISVVSPEKGALFVSAAGRILKRHLIREDFEQGAEGWYYDLQARIIRIKCRKPASDSFSIVVSTEKFDLIGMAGSPDGGGGGK